jgi:hypothetical protein
MVGFLKADRDSEPNLLPNIFIPERVGRDYPQAEFLSHVHWDASSWIKAPGALPITVVRWHCCLQVG